MCEQTKNTPVAGGVFESAVVSLRLHNAQCVPAEIATGCIDIVEDQTIRAGNNLVEARRGGRERKGL